MFFLKNISLNLNLNKLKTDGQSTKNQKIYTTWLKKDSTSLTKRKEDMKMRCYKSNKNTEKHSIQLKKSSDHSTHTTKFQIIMK